MQNIQAIPSAVYEQTMRETVRPYLKAHARPGECQGLYYEVYDQEEPAPATLVISHGFCETALKFGEVIYELHRRGIRVIAFDHYGHGRSRREAALGRLVHIDRFEQYAEGLGMIAEQIAKPLAAKDGSPLCLLGHSMGGAAALIYLERHPETFARAVLNAPMVQMYTAPSPFWAGVAISGGACMLGRAKKRAFVMNDFDAAKENVEHSACDSPTRFAEYLSQMVADPRLQHAAGTYGWVYEGSRATGLILQKPLAARLTMPLLMITAGRDQYVRNDAIDRLCAMVPSIRRETFPDSRHEIYRGSDENISRWLTLVYNFLTDEQ